MKTSVIEVRDMLSVLSVPGVKERIGEVPGVDSVTVNFSAGSATVRYDESRLDVGDIKSAVRQRSHEHDAQPVVPTDDRHESPAAPAGQSAMPESSAPKTPPVAPSAEDASSAEAAVPNKAAPSSAPKQAPDAAAAVLATPPAGDEQPDKSAPGKS